MTLGAAPFRVSLRTPEDVVFLLKLLTIETQPPLGLEEATALPLPGPTRLSGGDGQTAPDLEQPGDRWYRPPVRREVPYPLGELGAWACALALGLEGRL